MKRPCLLTVENTAPMNDNKQIDPRRASPRMGILAAYVMPWSPSPLSSKRTRGTTTDGIPERVGGRNPFHIQDLAEHHETRVAVSRECLKLQGSSAADSRLAFHGRGGGKRSRLGSKTKTKHMQKNTLHSRVRYYRRKLNWCDIRMPILINPPL